MIFHSAIASNMAAPFKIPCLPHLDLDIIFSSISVSKHILKEKQKKDFFIINFNTINFIIF